jgi:hypothetical protein
MKLLLSIGIVLLATLIGDAFDKWHVSGHLTSGERRTKLYPGTCPGGESWYLVDSDSDTVTVGCYDPDYSGPEN